MAGVGMVHLTAAMLEAARSPPTANPPGEVALTGGGRTPRILDYVFASCGLVASAECAVLDQATSATHTSTLAPSAPAPTRH